MIKLPSLALIYRDYRSGDLLDKGAILLILEHLAAQEAIRESVPVRSPEPGPTPSLAEQIAAVRHAIAAAGPIHSYKLGAAARTLERLARESDDGR